MASKKKDPEKTVDLPPHGSRNPDPITDQPGSHPIETGIGALIGGAASGMAVGAVATGPLAPVGAVVGLVAGAVAGGLAGKGVGELIDPTTKDNWLRDYFSSQEAKKHVREGETVDTYRPAYDYGVEAGTRHAGKKFDDVELNLKTVWDERRGDDGLAWDRSSPAVRHAFDRAGGSFRNG